MRMETRCWRLYRNLLSMFTMTGAPYLEALPCHFPQTAQRTSMDFTNIETQPVLWHHPRQTILSRRRKCTSCDPFIHWAIRVFNSVKEMLTLNFSAIIL